MIPDRLQYFLEYFSNDNKCDPIWTLGPRIYHENISTEQEKVGTSLNILLVHIWESELLKLFEGLCTHFLNSGIWHFENVRIWHIANWKFENWTIQYWKFANWTHGIRKSECERWKLAIFEIGSWKVKHVELETRISWKLIIVCFVLEISGTSCFIKVCEDGDRNVMNIG